MTIKYKSRRVVQRKHHNTKRHNRSHTLNNNKTISNDEEHDGREKTTFNTKSSHFDKVTLIISNLENKKHNKTYKHGHSNINYRDYKRGFH